MKRILLTLGVSTVLLAGLLLGGAFSRPEADGSLTAGTRASAAGLLDGFAAGSNTAALAAQLESRVATNPLDTKALVLLGLAYQQRARETGDPAFYEPSDRALERAKQLEPRNHLALAGLAALAASRHRFGEARRFARRALAVNPYAAGAWGILGDAEVETGRYEAAFAAFDRMVSIRPTTAAYARISYARELLGQTRAAAAAMRRAVVAAAANPEPAAWALTHLGNLVAEEGRLGRADRHYRHALAVMPGYAPALAGRARIELWRGNHGSSVRLWQAALDTQTVPEYAVGLGDALARTGDAAAAERAYERAESLEARFAANGGRNQLETALFDLDHGGNYTGALARARVGQRLRPSVEGEHVLAWALYKNGRCGEAREHSIRALHIGTKDWGAMLHRSLIEECLGNQKAARTFRMQALAVNAYALEAFGPLEGHRVAGR
jgi:tetratricopeptide (TPR) repeat protein